MHEPEHMNLLPLLMSMAPVTLGEMDGVRLMNRIDTKYVTDERKLHRLLADAVAAGYRVLEACGKRIAPYDSVYFDTPGLKMYYDHRNRRLTRQKVRTRCYVASGIAFLEIKRKNNKGRTKKKRCPLPAGKVMDFRGDADAEAFLSGRSDFSAAELMPSMETLFHRITLVNPDFTERITIDTCMEFKNVRTGLKTSLDGAVIIELKQDGRAESRMKRILLGNRIHPMKISKYCLAVTLTDPSARPGRFKAKILRIEKITNKKIIVE